jgi:hypothetical protein
MIIGVAIRNEIITVKLPKPSRHCDCFRYLLENGVDYSKMGIGVKAKDQGFYTHTGRYLDRIEAVRYVKRIKQKTIDGPAYGALFSEDLW